MIWNVRTIENDTDAFHFVIQRISNFMKPKISLTLLYGYIFIVVTDIY